MLSRLLALLQRIGTSLLVPIAVLPAAAILLRLGAKDIFNIPIMSQAGKALFDALPLLFAVGVAIGFTSQAGIAGLSSLVGYLVFSATLKQINEKIDMGVLGGILIGLLSAYLYERFHQVKLPPFLAFFGGRRFPPLISAFAALFLALICGYIWLPIQEAIGRFGEWMVKSGGIGLFIYGTMNRLLIPFGLHHIINSLVWFTFGTYQVGGKVYHGDMGRFFAGDPSAGSFMAGFYPIMLFALPAVCLAMYQEAKPERKQLAGGILLSAALTSIVTGVTEPIEFSFMFLAPQLYVLHAVLTGSSLVVAHLLGAKSGFSFSAGLIDFFLNLGLSHKAWLLLLLGVLYFLIYYISFRYLIRRLNLPTPGREE